MSKSLLRPRMDVEELLLEKKKLKIQYHIDKTKINNQIRENKKILSDKNRKDNKILIIILDLLLLFAILSNVGALVLTNAMVIKNNPEKQLMEANPVVAKKFDYKVHPQAIEIMKKFFVHVLYLAGLIFYYIYMRNNMYTWYHKYLLMLLVIMVFTALFLDFTNDLGYYIGVLLYRG